MAIAENRSASWRAVFQRRNARASDFVSSPETPFPTDRAWPAALKVPVRYSVLGARGRLSSENRAGSKQRLFIAARPQIAFKPFRKNAHVDVLTQAKASHFAQVDKQKGAAGMRASTPAAG